MAIKRRKTKLTEALNSLNKTDIYSLMLFTLYKMNDDPKYSTLSELCYILDGDNLSKLLSYYGGMTIKIPTLREMRLLLQALLLFQYVNLEKGTFEEGLKAVTEDEFEPEEIKSTYKLLLEVVDNYEFNRE